MSRSQRNKHYRKNWRESRQLKQEGYDRKLKLPKRINRREEFNSYLEEFGAIDNNNHEEESC